MKESARALQLAALVFAARVLAAVGNGTDVRGLVGVEAVATEIAPAGHWFEPVLGVSAQRIAFSLAQFDKVLVVAGPAPAGVELAGSFLEKTGWSSVSFPVQVPA